MTKECNVMYMQIYKVHKNRQSLGAKEGKLLGAARRTMYSIC